MIACAVERTDLPMLCGPEAPLSKKLMSPFVWAEPGNARLHLPLRAVPMGEDAQQRDSHQIWSARGGSDGLLFQMRPEPVPVPDAAGPDMRRCEDSTVVHIADGDVVYGTEVGSDRTGDMPYATGSDPRAPIERCVARADGRSEKDVEQAAVQRYGNGWSWLYVDAHDGRLVISLTDAEGMAGSGASHPTRSASGQIDGTASTCPPNRSGDATRRCR